MFDIFKYLKGKIIENCDKILEKDINRPIAAFIESGKDEGKIMIRGSLKELEETYNRILKGACSDVDIRKVHTLFHEFEHLFSKENGISQGYNMFGGKSGSTIISEICNDLLARERMRNCFPNIPLFLDKGNGGYVRKVYDFERLCQRLKVEYPKLLADLHTLKSHEASTLGQLMAKYSSYEASFCKEVLENFFACGDDFDPKFGTPLKGRDYVEKVFKNKKIIKKGENLLPKPEEWFFEWAKYGGAGYTPFEDWAKDNQEKIKSIVSPKADSKAKAQVPSVANYDRRHLANLSRYERLVDEVYKEACKKAGRLAPLLGELRADVALSIDEYPNIRKRVDSLLDALKKGLYGVIVNGMESEWTLSNNKNDEIARQVFGKNVGKLSQQAYRRYFSTNGSARDAFISRKQAGMNLSDRVWNYTSQFKAEMEQVLDIGIRNGLSAEEIQRELQQYLVNPDNFFRRFRYKEGVDDYGKPIFGRKWKKRYFDESTGEYKWMDVDLNDPKYKYGRGVYRSSYKNARRVAVTETNIAYRTADHLRWQQFDFVVGIRIECSKTNHPIPDICDILAGDYPKDFKWTGWHPHCRCHATSILKTPEELAEDSNRILNGEAPTETSANEIKTMPTQFNDFCKENAKSIKSSRKRGTEPYFIRENSNIVDDIINS